MRDRPLGNAAGRRLSLPLLLALACGSVLAAGSGSGVRAQESMERRSPTQRLVLAYYLYSFQGDPRKPVPTQGIRTEKGQSLLTDHPWDSVGPWFSYDRAVWHRSQLQNMTCAGIDVALTVYRGGLKDRRTWAIKGLDALAQALKEMRGEGTQALTRRQEFPRIGLALDLRGLADQYGGPADLRQPDVQRSLYGMLRDFFLHVPEEFRARVHLPAARVPREIGGGASPRGVAYVVSLLHEEGVTGGGPGILGALSRRFGAEFGASLVWVGTPTLQRSLPELDAVADYPAASRPVAFHQAGWIRTASLGPGADGSAGGGRSPIRSRETGSAFVQDLRQVIQEAPDWVLLDSWNDYARGTEIAPSFEHGQQYKDLLRGAVLDFKQSQDYAAQFLHTNAPRVIQSGSVYQVEVVVQNSGTADWDQTNVASLTYRWFQNGTAVGRPGVTIQRTGQKRGESRPYLIGVLGPVLEEKGPAPPGEYELEFTMSRLARG
ncbi:MAG: hypothetical protein FJ315_04010, partial [SAR202 cluster bacterium]|nr:hypothetical protein [SAR202 cluster bacterium]